MSSAFDVPHTTIGDWPALVEQIAGQQPNQASFDAVLTHGYAAITARLEPYQQALVANAESQIADMAARAKEMRELASELRTVAEIARDGAVVDLDVYQSTDNRAQRLMSAVTDAPARVQKLAADLVDPLSGLTDLEVRMPSLRQRPPIA